MAPIAMPYRHPFQYHSQAIPVVVVMKIKIYLLYNCAWVDVSSAISSKTTLRDQSG